MIDVNKLPPPNVYNLTDLAKRWGCSVQQIMQYIAEGKLSAESLGWLANLEPGHDDEFGYKVTLKEIERFEEKCGIASKKDSLTVSSKSKNSYLRLIKALCTYAAAGSLTGHQHKDADVVIAALRGKGIDPGIEPETLAKYLKEAKNL